MYDNTILKFEGISKQYKYVRALDNINLTLEKGHIYGLIGNNGAGKTTIMRIIMGLCKASSGSLEIFGETKPKEIIKLRKKIGVIIESPIYQENMSAVKNLDFLRILYGIKDKSVVQNVMNILHLDINNKNPIKLYSMGMKQRVSLAGALMINPEFLVLDEPLTSLDPSGQEEIRDILLDIFDNRKIPMLISSHNLDQLNLLATDYIIINNGKILEEITQSQLTRKCKETITDLKYDRNDNKKHKGDYLLITSDSSEQINTIIKSNFRDCICEIIDKNNIKIINYNGEIRKLFKILSEAKIIKMQSVGITLEEYFNNVIKNKVNLE